MSRNRAIMEYNGKYSIFKTAGIKTYPLSTRINKVGSGDILDPACAACKIFDISQQTTDDISAVAQAVVAARHSGKPVILFTGAHLVKNGMARLLADLVNRGIITLVAGNGATAIHDFELALIGQTSEDVPDALEKGQFGMAYEFAYHNTAIQLGDKYKLGYGESLGRMICDEDFRREVLKILGKSHVRVEFTHSELSILAACYKKDIPFTVHVGIGTDVIDQHPSSDPESKGACSGRDFLIYVDQVSNLTEGGVILNVGSAVTGPEVLLKAVSMAANVGKRPDNIVTADFDLRNFKPDEMTNETAENYYFRDQKSVVTRIPRAFNGQGYYIQANQKESAALLYKTIIEKI